MSAELKQRIIDRLQDIEDKSLLNEVLRIIEVESDTEKVYQLTEAEERAVNEGIADYKAGRVYSDEEANQKIREWLKK